MNLLRKSLKASAEIHPRMDYPFIKSWIWSFYVSQLPNWPTKSVAVFKRTILQESYLIMFLEVLSRIFSIKVSAIWKFKGLFNNGIVFTRIFIETMATFINAIKIFC